MALAQQKFREIVFQILYSYDVTEGNIEDIVPFFMNYMKVTKKTVYAALQKAQEIFSAKEELDEHMQRHIEGYAFPRVSSVEKNLLRLSLFAFLKDDKIPAAIIIAEGIRMCKKFGTPESAKFVQAVLDAAVKGHALITEK